MRIKKCDYCGFENVNDGEGLKESKFYTFGGAGDYYTEDICKKCFNKALKFIENGGGLK